MVCTLRCKTARLLASIERSDHGALPIARVLFFASEPAVTELSITTPKDEPTREPSQTIIGWSDFS